jgi:hypothetical protein
MRALLSEPMTSEAEFRKIFDDAARRRDESQGANAGSAPAALERLIATYKTACLALRDSMLSRGLPGYPVVTEPNGPPCPDRAFFIGYWGEEDETEDGKDTSDPCSVVVCHTFVLLTSGVATEARWLPDQHAFLVPEQPMWMQLTVRRGYETVYRLVSAKTPFDSGDLIKHLTTVALANGQFYLYKDEPHLATAPQDDVVPWEL